jgi:sensor domain CHASE-containing protein
MLGEARPDHAALSGETRRSLSEALGRLLWVYLQLLVTRQATTRLLQGGQAGRGRHRDDLQFRIADLEGRLKSGSLDPDLRRSLEGQLDLLGQRLEGQKEARQKLDFIDSELVRVEEQITLVHEQALLAPDAESASGRIDAIGSALGSTTQWIRDQARLSGELADSLEGSPPPVRTPEGAS